MAPAQAGETVLHSFNPYRQGAYPQANVCLGPGNKLYGTASGGGPSGAGVVYRVNNANNGAVLHSFTGAADGGTPYSSVLCNSAGNLYGTTLFGGSSGAGVVYRVDGSGHQSVLYSFTGDNDGGNPFAGVIQDSSGNLYGTTAGGGSAGSGVVFKLDTKGHETVLYTFTGGSDGGFPNGVIRDSTGNLFGTTGGGGASSAGVVFKLDTTGHESVLYSFTDGNDGGYPNAGVVLDSAGNLYGTTTGGGTGGGGVVFKLNTAGQETPLYSFTNGTDGGYPYAGVILDSAGNLYGTTLYGGSAFVGVVYKVDPTGHETVLYSFTGKADGAYPAAGVVSDSAGNLYGAASGGGPAGAGAVFKLDTTLHETVLYGFPGSDGSGPWAGVTQDSAGALYGTTTGGGSAGAGIVYKLDTTGHETILYSFTGGADGANPYAGVILDSAGNLYGTAKGGGTYGAGVVYKLAPTGQYTILYTFAGSCCGFPTIDGAQPNGGVIMDAAGNLYGTTTFGGSSGWGTIYKLDPTGHETILHNFTNGSDGGQVYSGVTMDAAGNLYGTTLAGGTDFYGFGAGVVYKLDPAGEETVLYNFCTQPGCIDGAGPLAGVVLDSAGNLYGTTASGGPSATDDPGVVYKVAPTGQQTVLYAFVGTTDGNSPIGGVVLDSAGNLYGTTEAGGPGSSWPYGSGVVLKVDTTGHETVLYTFTGGADGGVPKAGVIRDAAGNLYGTTYSGGSAGAGVVYKITPSAATAQPSYAGPPLRPPFAERPMVPLCSLPLAQRLVGCPSPVPSKETWKGRVTKN